MPTVLEATLVHQICPSQIMASDARLNHYMVIFTGDRPGPGSQGREPGPTQLLEYCVE